QAAISKIARQFMTKLHIQVNQTMQFYRGQQGGSTPVRLFLSGGASIMPYTAQFFAEKLNVPVEYFNPFRNVQIDPALNLEELAKVAHSLGEVVGLGLRNLANCPVEMNLMPDSTLRWRAFNEKKPYFLATVFLLALVAGAIGFMLQKLAQAKEDQIADLQPRVEELQRASQKYQEAKGRLDKAQGEAGQITTWLGERFYWGDLFAQLRGALMRAEEEVRQKYEKQMPGIQAGIWIEQFAIGSVTIANPAAPAGADPNETPPPQQQTSASPNVITMVCRAMDLSTALQTIDPAADNEIVFAVERQIKATPVFDPKSVQTSAQISSVDAKGTYTFTVTLSPQVPFKRN